MIQEILFHFYVCMHRCGEHDNIFGIIIKKGSPWKVLRALVKMNVNHTHDNRIFLLQYISKSSCEQTSDFTVN